MKRFIMIAITCASWINISAQSANDVMMFSQHYSGGTARSAGMGGAFGALGGDLSVLSANPAGLAVYRGSELTITPALVFTNTRSEYDNRTFKDNSTHLIFNNIGYVYTKNLYNEKGFQSINFGIAYNRLGDLYSKAYIKRQQATSSLLDEFVYYAYDDFGNPLPENQLNALYEGVAWETYAINFDKNNNEYYSNYTNNGYGQPLYRSMTTGGGIGEFDFSMGANFNNKLFLGATLGIQSIYFKDSYYHEESPLISDMDAFEFKDTYTVDGVGINFKAGLIYRPIQMLRLGAAIHTPTHLRMKPYQLTRMDTYWNTSPDDNGGKYFFAEADTDPSEHYRMRTPWRYIFSAATVLGNFGMWDVDLEIVDYSSSSIAPKSTYDIENGDISKDLKTALNLKTGVEFRLGPVFLRGGLGYYGNPYNKNQFASDLKKTLKATMCYSGGIGFRNRDFYMDAAYSFIKHPERLNRLYLSYDDRGDWDEIATLQTKTGKFVVTFGFKF